MPTMRTAKDHEGPIHDHSDTGAEDSDVDLGCVMDELLAKRAELAAAHPTHEDNFVWALRGGAWAAVDPAAML